MRIGKRDGISLLRAVIKIEPRWIFGDHRWHINVLIEGKKQYGIVLFIYFQYNIKHFVLGFQLIVH